jgi:hypothetical protein
VQAANSKAIMASISIVCFDFMFDEVLVEPQSWDRFFPKPP